MGSNEEKGPLTHATAMGGTRLSRGIGRAILRLLGWRVEGTLPALKQYVMIAAPHTSNWDFPYMLLYGLALGFRPSWMGKDALFRWPFGWLMRRLGGIPIDRRAANNIVAQTIYAFDQHAQLVVLIPPEGTRSRATRWKSGFYHIARGAGVPIVLSYLDFAQKRGGIGPTLTPTDDRQGDLRRIAAFYADKRGKFPANESPVLEGE